jgi:hypothetical protein
MCLNEDMICLPYEEDIWYYDGPWAMGTAVDPPRPEVGSVDSRSTDLPCLHAMINTWQEGTNLLESIE